jgi:formylglycine-generating enzyme required for sulfatase activity
MKMVTIEGGTFEMGSTVEEIERYLETFEYAFRQFSRHEARKWFLKQTPKIRKTVRSFDLSKYLVTNDDYKAFEQSVFQRVFKANIRKPDHPVQGVSFADSLGYCQWLSQCSGETYRLPTEEEWEFAASSRGKTIFPWGDEFQLGRANTKEQGIGDTTPVGAFSAGASAQGIMDLGGNVEEWTQSIYLPYLNTNYIADDISEDTGRCYPIARGGSYALNGDLCLASRRHGYRPNYTIVGFRVVRSTLL